MRQINENQGNTAEHREYRTPKLRKFGSVSELTLTQPRPATGNDGGSFFNQYGS
ncbi:lasso RiPP family leader peptide-containing protein [Roseofilum reptotaenium CS-1145]|uniref:lasso RiPP family leader peptide-containing protein n=1 Tax=Roseofilum reptotaenium TaxID=1233427 RepID=UPI000B1B021C|nr:lasso RiPP family leader peptide-containing protein [Roseofilum reptotaenium]MDB9518578.1 lasso RiPP family leader peptide-containing protein [Roseofilum reptotaenium CS-1145]